MPAKINSALDLPFREQIEFFRQKLNLPTAKWDDIWQSQHDVSFVVAGAMKADLLADLAAAVGPMQRITQPEFNRRFRDIVQQHGWHGWTGEGSAKGEAWRMRTIFETNISTSYAAGRYAQLTDPELLSVAPWWRYVHSDSVLHPRENHKQWGDSGLTLRHDHPFWKTHFPPNGWGCHCHVTAVRKPKAGDATTPPAGWDATDPKTGAPPGIDKGWAYAPGASVAERIRQLVEEKADKYPLALLDQFLSPELTDIVLAQSQEAAAIIAEKRANAKIRADALSQLPASLADGQGKNAIGAVLQRGQKDGNEHLAAYDAASGEVYRTRTDGLADRVKPSAKVMRQMENPDAALVLVHNHTEGLSLSRADLTLLSKPGVARVAAQGHDGSVFVAGKTDQTPKPKRLDEIIKIAEAALAKQYVLAAERGLRLDRLAAHLVNRALHDEGLINYEFRLDAPRQSLYTQETAAIDAIVDAIRKAMWKDWK